MVEQQNNPKIDFVLNSVEEINGMIMELIQFLYNEKRICGSYFANGVCRYWTLLPPLLDGVVDRDEPISEEVPVPEPALGNFRRRFRR